MGELIQVRGGPNPDRAGDIVFVHGLNGNAREYWQRKGRPETFWPEWLAGEPDLPDVSVWSLAYEAAAFEWRGGAMPLHVRANNALDLLSQFDIGHVPIVFVTHSLGGLLVKQMLRNGKELRQPRAKAIADQTCGVVFISTPHSGARLATFVRYIGWLLRSSVAVEDLEASAPQLDQLNTWFRENVGSERDDDLHVKTLVYYEERKTYWRFLKLIGSTVVDRASADPGIRGVIPIGLDFDHSTIHKPESKTSQLYLGVKRHIQECLFPDLQAGVSGALASRIVGNIPFVPSSFVTRPEVTTDLQPALCDKTASEGEPVVFALKGHPGVGKTTLCADLARRLAAGREFRDGIFWITLGENPADLLGLVGGLIQELGDRSYRARELQTASGHLKALLRNKRALIVIDDAWNAAHVRPFLADGPHCRVLITTRDASVARILNARVFAVEPMTPDDSVLLLSRQVQRSLTGEARDRAVELANLVGNLPMALQVAASLLAGGMEWDELLATLINPPGKLNALEAADSDEWDPESRRAHSIKACFEASVNRLQPGVKTAFALLSLFRPGAVLTGARTARLWGMDERGASDRLRYLADKSLLIPVAKTSVGGYRMHDLMHDFAKGLVVTFAGFATSWAEAQSKFLESFRQADPRAWPNVPDDGYLYDNLHWHLQQAGRAGELFDLLESAELHSGRQWYEACEQHGNIAAFISTAQEIRRISDDRCRATGDPVALARSLRSVLLLGSLNSMGAIPGELSVALVRAGVWTLDHAVSYIRRQADPAGRIHAAIALIAAFQEHVSDDLYDEVLRDIRAQPAYDYYRELLPLVRHVAGHPAVASAILKSIDTRRIELEPDWIRLVAKLLPLVTEEEAHAFADSDRRFSDDDPSYAAWKAAVTLPYVDPKWRGAALDYARKIKYWSHKALAFASLALHGPAAGREPLVRQALKAFLMPRDVFDWDELFRDLEPALLASPPLAKEALDAVLQQYSRRRDKEDVEYVLGRVFATLARPLSMDSDLVDRALQTAAQFRDAAARLGTLISFASCVPEPRRSAIMSEAEALLAFAEVSAETRTVAAIRLAELAPPERRRELLMEIRARLTTIGGRRSFLNTCRAMLPSVPASRRSDLSLRIAQSDGTPESAEFLAETAEPETGVALADAGSEPAKRKAELAVAGASEVAANPGADGPVDFRSAWAQAVAIADPHDRCIAMVRLLAHAGPDREPELVLAVVRESQSIGGEDYQADALIELAKTSSLRPKALEIALPMARSMRDHHDRGVTIAFLLPHTPPSERAALFQEALQAIRQVKDLENWQLDYIVCVALLPNCPESELDNLLEFALTGAIDRRRPAERTLDAAIQCLAPRGKERILPLLFKALDVLSTKDRQDTLVFLARAHPLILAAAVRKE